MLGPLVANVVAAQAGVRPPTQSVTYTDTDKEKERGDAGNDTQRETCVWIEKDGPRQIHTHKRPVSITERESVCVCVCVIEEEE
jgi:hypothetical protein